MGFFDFVWILARFNDVLGGFLEGLGRILGRVWRGSRKLRRAFGITPANVLLMSDVCSSNALSRPKTLKNDYVWKIEKNRGLRRSGSGPGEPRSHPNRFGERSDI